MIPELQPAALRTICGILLSPLSLFTHVAPILNTGVLAGIQGVWAGIIFFTGASVGLCLRFLLETVDNTGVFQFLLSRACTEQRSLFLTSERLGVHKGLGGVTAGTADPH